MRGFIIICIAWLFFPTSLFATEPIPNNAEAPNGKTTVHSILVAGVANKKLKKVCNSWLGTKYQYGGCSKKGVDCSCLAKNIYKQVYGIELDRTSGNQYKQCKPIRKQKKLREGDLVFFKINGMKISHVGIYLGEGYFIHASTKLGVVLNNLSEEYYAGRYFRGGRIK